MKPSAPWAIKRVAVLSAFLAGQALSTTSVFAETADPIVNPASCTAASSQLSGGAVPVETVTGQDTVYTRINDKVVPRLTDFPAVEAPLDTLKLQINNRMNSGLLTGKLSNDEMDEVQAMLDAVQRQEAEFKLGGCGLTEGAVNNLMRKYHTVDQRLSELLDNTNFVEYMPNFEMRRAGLQRRIQFHVADGNLTPSEGEQLLAALNNVSDLYASAQATGNTVTGNELEALHRDLCEIHEQLIERVNGTIAFVAPATNDKLAELRSTIACAVASHRFSDEERCRIIDQYNKLLVLQNSVTADEGLDSPEIRLLAKEIDNLNFILARELRDRQTACHGFRM